MSKRFIAFFSLFIVSVFLGLLLAVQFRVSNDFPNNTPRESTQELANELRQITRNNNNLQDELYDLREKLNQVRTGQNEAVEALNSELTKAQMAAGLVSVTGPGVEVVLDNPERSKMQSVGEYIVIRDDDLLKVVNELRGAGAEAISINGERIIATSEIRNAGSFININTERLVPPYKIVAIGNPDTLERSLNLPGGLCDYLGDLGIRVKVSKQEELTIPAYSRNFRFEHAESV